MLRRSREGHQSWSGPAPALVLLALATSAAAEPELELETIVVTATRRDESLQSVASSVSAVSGNFIDDLGARDIREIMAVVPGLAIVTGGDTKYTLRGVSTDTWEEQRPATAEYLDETPITNAAALVWTRDTLPYLIDMDRVEVLRGPQGTLFGSSSMGGTVRYMTRRPSMNRSEGWAQLGATATEHGSPGYSVSGMFNAPLRDGVLALRGVGFYDVLGGFIDNRLIGVDDVNEHRLSGGRLALAWHPDERLTAIARVFYQRQADDGTNQRDLGDPPYTQTRLTDESGTSERTVVSLDVDYVGTAISLHSTTSWLSTDITSRFDQSDFLRFALGFENPLTSVNGQETEDFIQEFRLESTAAEHVDWLAGAFYQHRDTEFTQSLPAPGFDEATGGAAADFGYPDNLYVTNLAQPVDEIAGYGELGWRPNEQWRISAGARWFRFSRHEREVSDGLLNDGPSDRKGDATESDVSPRFAISYKPSDEQTYYAVISNGYRPGGPNLPPPAGLGCSAELAGLGYDSPPLSFESDELWNYEIGGRRTSRDGRFSIAGSLYRIDWSRMQTYVFLECAWGFAQNSGEARNDGVEFELGYLPTADVELRLAGSYVDARLEKPAAGLGGKPGDPLPGVPDVTGSVSAQWRFFRNESLSASVHGLWSYVGERYASPSNLTDTRMDAYDTLTLRLRLESARWLATFSLENALDEDGVVFLHDTFVGRYETTIWPRMWRLTVQYDF